MASILGFFSRNYAMASPTPVPKTTQPLRFGLISCANIIPMAFLTPSLTHPDISITAIAARDVSKATLFAKKHNIPKIHPTYQDLLDDPDIDAVYIPLPNGLHYEWTLKALKAGKHVYLEKPSVSNAIEAEKLFRHPLLSQPGAPVLLEAAHSWFHPAWHNFMRFVRSADIERAESSMMVPPGVLKEGDIRFDYDLAGGAMMDLGPYAIGSIRLVFGGELPTECESMVWEGKDGKAEGDVDVGFDARYRFKNGGVGVARGCLSQPLKKMEWPIIVVTHGEEVFKGAKKFEMLGTDAGEVPSAIVKDGEKEDKTKEDLELVRTRTVTLSVFFTPHIYHTVSVKDDCALRYVEGEKKGKVFKEWKMRKDYKTYSFSDVPGLESQAGNPHWATYRYCLEQFVNKIRGKETPQWFGVEDSIKTARMIDMAYEKAGMKLRPTSVYE